MRCARCRVFSTRIGMKWVVFYVYSDLIVQGIRHVTLLAQKRCGKPSTLHIAWYAAPFRVLNVKREWRLVVYFVHLVYLLVHSIRLVEVAGLVLVY